MANRSARVTILFSCLLGLSKATPVDSVGKVVEQALWQTTVTKHYDPSYVKLKYPGGDVPIERGVCVDVVIRAFRAVGIDFQNSVHIDMKANFSAYPAKWGLRKPDPNIDHRRVPNLATFLKRKGKQIPVSAAGSDYLPGDIVTWRIPGDLDHIGIVSSVPVDSTDRFGVVHNIGQGAKLEDVLFEFTITGHYRYFAPVGE